MTTILLLRIAGNVDVNEDVAEALFRLRLRKKFTAILIEDTPENLKLIDFVRNFIAFGPISKEVLAELIAKRGDKKKDNKVFHLHPPRGGIDSKIHAGKKKGVLGDNKEKINDLVRRML